MSILNVDGWLEPLRPRDASMAVTGTTPRTRLYRRVAARRWVKAGLEGVLLTGLVLLLTVAGLYLRARIGLPN